METQTPKIDLNQLLEPATKDKRKLQGLKALAVKHQRFELAANLRCLEKELFPDTEEQVGAKGAAKEVNMMMRMVQLNVDLPTCWLINEVLKLRGKQRDNFSIKDAAKLMAKRDELFEIERTTETPYEQP